MIFAFNYHTMNNTGCLQLKDWCNCAGLWRSALHKNSQKIKSNQFNISEQCRNQTFLKNYLENKNKDDNNLKLCLQFIYLFIFLQIIVRKIFHEFYNNYFHNFSMPENHNFKKNIYIFIDIPLETWLYNTVYTVELTDDFTNRNLKHYPHKHTYGGKQMKYDQT